MSDTPKTDAATHDDWSGGAAAVEVEVAQQLERELNEARNMVRELRDALSLALEFFAHWDGVPMWAGMSDAQDALTKANKLLP